MCNDITGVYVYALILHIDAMLVLVHYDGIVIMFWHSWSLERMECVHYDD